MSKPRVVVGMSGGVDSSVAALLLKAQGYDVLGLFMKNWEDDDTDEFCTSRADLIDAVAAADRIGIEIETVNFSAEYQDRVFQNFLAEYQAGRTPNPDVLCNAEIKFRAFLDHALSVGAERIATGHYARILATNNRYELLKGVAPTKDQSYFLYRLNQEQLSKSIFPLGELTKNEVRTIARKFGLANHDKKDSTGICFIGERPFREFLSRYLPRQPGDIETPDGTAVARHEGLMYYTIGQRKGLGIGGEGAAWYVAQKDLRRNVLVTVQGHDHPALFKNDLVASQLSWIAGEPPAAAQSYAAKTRYRQRDAVCRITTVDEQRCEVLFDSPQWAVTPGQSLVAYREEVCLGGGIIEA
ncbi:MAG: tRNA 2-thiouridine(34) synthase MnmA [Burkholderiales bacterium]|nr:tRNA 2-thiouridine(34) synthase MnmA [Burkholderiales bacterium]